ncbi:type IX secretion system membrane protein PorP/SprF [Algoriphagus aestuariicola]|uniref:Type IX secretion system membrane protein PorP/SprF n=1 Tax=Algoriphagus aestuariicola TaxID=1852016 RepID=A0ABS3BW76_9BACT|nr:type IX secretion system membrane protein PorP/SprF [Algoriphagus aestuariicola]MBN7803548.1 type IX secretion system membrane protein PorP/SprF [Algoriphagus aestuariicola]
MKNITCVIVVLIWGLSTVSSLAQNRKYVSQFSEFQSYFNPALTGYEGSVVRGFVRNQWGGIEGAPMTYFVNAELDFGELAGEMDPALMGKNAVSVNFLQDNFGAFRESELMLNYASRIRLTERHNLRLGAGINYQSIRLDGNSLTAEELNDPTIANYIGTFSNMNTVDFNLGIALTHAKYYFSYGVQRVTGGEIQNGDEFMDGYPAEQMIMAGYREALGENLAVSANGFYRSRKDLPEVFDFNLKLLMRDMFWVGLGHRVNYANSVQAGFLFGKFRAGYVYEYPMAKSYLLSGGVHEFSLVFNIFRPNERRETDEVLIW